MLTTPRRRATTPRIATCCAVALSLLLAACSDDDDDDAADTTTGSTSASTEATVEETPETTEAAASDPVLVLGLMGPGVGLADELVIGQERGLTLAVEDINAAGGVLGGPVATVRVDESSTTTTQDTLDALVAEGAGAIVGPVSSSTAVEVRQLAAEQGLIACSASATAPIVTQDDTPAALFRTALRDDYLASIVAERILPADTPADAPRPTVAIVARDDTYGTSLAGGLAAELVSRGIEPQVISYPARRVKFPTEGQAVASAGADVTIAISLEEGPNLLAAIVDAGYPADRLVGLDGFANPRIAEQTFPQDPSRLDGFRVVSTTGDRAFLTRLEEVPASQDQVSYGAQAYDCAITLALAMAAAGSVDPVAASQRVREVTEGGRTCSNFADCMALLEAGEDLDYDGATGGIAIDEQGDPTTARINLATVAAGELGETEVLDIDLEEIRRLEVFASGVFATQVQQVLRLLGYYDGPITGVFDEATSEAIRALQRDLGLPETGEWDEATDAAVRELSAEAAALLSSSTAQLQQALTDLGYYDGPIDGVWSAATRDAVRALQRDLGVPETGIIDTATLVAAYQRGLAEGGATTTTVPATDPPATTAPPTTAAPTTLPPTTEPAPETTAPEPEPGPEPEGNLFEVLAADPQFSTLVDLLRSVGYDEDMTISGPLTMFAPTNDAFAGVDEATLDEIRGDQERIDNVLAYHLVQGLLDSASLAPGEVQTIHGDPVTIAIDGSTVRVNTATVVEADIRATNGIVHAIDQVLIPPA